MSFWDRLASFLKPQSPFIQPGALPDTRPDAEKAGDVHFSEIVASANAAAWSPLALDKLPDWPVLDQGATSACVAFSKALMSSILYSIRTGVWVLFSPKWIYSQRRNKPAEGMIAADAFDIEASAGIVPENMAPSTGLTEQQITSYSAQPWEKEVGKALRMSDQRVILPSKDIDIVVSVQQTTGKPIMVWFQWFYDEWTLSMPKILHSNPPYTHSVVFVPPRLPGQNSLGIHQGEKAIVIQDSWGLESATLNGKRIITESFYKERNYFAAYSMRFKFDESVGGRPLYDGTIISAQKCLQFEGCFPMNVSFVESVGPVTKKSLAQFQQKHNLPASAALDTATINLLKLLYSK